MSPADGEPERSAAVRVWSRLPPGTRAELEDHLSPTDLQTLLLDLARTRARRVTPARLRQRWQQDRFVRPAAVDPRRLVAVEAALWRSLPATFEGLALSPVTPLGSCSALGPVDQHRVLSTTRSSEVVSDPTNVLALEAAVRRRDGAPAAHLAACHRVLRAQRFAAADALPHFSLFTLVSSARDTGAARTEADLLLTHLAFWSSALAELIGSDAWRLDLTVITDPAMEDRVHDTVAPGLPGTAVRDAPERTQGIGYYRSAAFKIMSVDGSTASEIGDGGFTDWTAALMADAKERCLISCVSTEALTGLVGAAGG
jgi:hypothetical protein